MQLLFVSFNTFLAAVFYSVNSCCHAVSEHEDESSSDYTSLCK